MEELIEGAKLTYELSEQDAENINDYIAKHPDRHPASAHVEAGEHVAAIVVRSRGPGQAGDERLAVRLIGPEKAYHVWADGLQYADGAWRKLEGGE